MELIDLKSTLTDFKKTEQTLNNNISENENNETNDTNNNINDIEDDKLINSE
jgi:hypothetical protein